MTKQITRLAPSPASASVARDLLALVEAFGTPPHDLLHRAGLTHLAADLLSGRGVALGRVDFAHLYAHCTWVLDAAAAQQEGREPMPKAGIDMLCHCVITCRNLRDVIWRMDQYSALLVPRMARLRLAVEGGVARVEMATQRSLRNACAYLSDLTGLAMYHRLFGWLIGETVPLRGVEMRYGALLDPRTTAYLMPFPVLHDAAENAISFPAALLERPLVRTPVELEQLLVHFPFDLDQPQSSDHALSERIYHQLVAQLASGEPLATAQSLSRQFSISVATLKRRLLGEGTSLSALKLRAREELAKRMLADPRLSVTETARALHFSDAGAFRRAFRNWTGQSPSQWRGF